MNVARQVSKVPRSIVHEVKNGIHVGIHDENGHVNVDAKARRHVRNRMTTVSGFLS